MNTDPFWNEARVSHPFPPLITDLEVDVLIIGGGITGVTTAHLLSSEGYKVALVERHEIGGSDTGHTTAHLTYMTDTRLSKLISICGEEHALNSWEAGRMAMEHIHRVATGFPEEVGLVEVPGYLVASNGSDLQQERNQLIDEARIASRLGFDVEFLEQTGPTKAPGIRFERQMKFHPVKYLQALVAQGVQQGVMFFEDTEINSFDASQGAKANGRHIRYHNLIIATHMPIQGTRTQTAAAWFQTKLASYSTYAIAARIPTGSLEEMIWSDTADPFNYLRVEKTPDGEIAILGGEDHKTGQEPSTEACFSRLEETLSQFVTHYELRHRWSGRVIETIDGLPYIGEIKPGEYIATGFSGNGMTFGTAAALLIRDMLLKKHNPWKKTFDPARRDHYPNISRKTVISPIIL
jgi:glycine/D-amino acid oxidase-like deaminating enzyme